MFTRVVRTPLWTDNPDKMAQYAIADNVLAVTVEDVAQSMLDLIQDGIYVGGTIFKIDTGVKEVVRVDGQILPPAEGVSAEDVQRARERIVQPVRELLRGERGKGVGS